MSRVRTPQAEALRVALGATMGLSEHDRRRLQKPGECVYCSRPLNCPMPRGHIDHLFPKSRGGPNHHANLVAACEACNCAKKDRTPSEWFDHMASLDRASDEDRMIGLAVLVFDLARAAGLPHWESGDLDPYLRTAPQAPCRYGVKPGAARLVAAYQRGVFD